MAESAIVIGHRIVRLELDRGVEVGDGAAEVALEFIGVAAVIEGDRVVRVELDRLIEILDGAVDRVLVPERQAAIVISETVAGVVFYRLIEIENGAIEVAFGPEGDASVVVTLRISRIDLEGLGQVGNGTLEIAPVGIGIAAIVPTRPKPAPRWPNAAALAEVPTERNRPAPPGMRALFRSQNRWAGSAVLLDLPQVTEGIEGPLPRHQGVGFGCGDNRPDPVPDCR